MPTQDGQGPDLNTMLGETTTGCVGELLRLIIVGPFKIVRGIFRYRGSLIIWPLPILLILVFALTHQYSAMIVIILLATLITYISKWIGSAVKWQRMSPLEKELGKIMNMGRRRAVNQEEYMNLRAAAIHLKSPGDIKKLDSMRSRNLITDEEYMRLRDDLIGRQQVQ